MERPTDAVSDARQTAPDLAANNLADIDPELLLTVLGRPADEASLLPVRGRARGA